jgi:pyruvate kinase
MLERKLLEIFGRNQNTRRIRIMVTMPTEAANDYPFVRELVDRGMDCIRINCAHDSVKEWANMLGNLRRAEAETGRKCKVYMDLAGPKVRTSNLIKPKDQKLIFVGDKLLLTLHPKKNNETYPVQISCTLKEVFPQIKLGSRVFIDDGKIGTVVREIVPEGFVLEVFQANPEGAKLKTEKGMNFPDMELNIAALTAKDKQDLDFAAKYADIIGYSFVQSAKDIAILQQELEKRLGDNWRKMAIVAKIETPRAVANLPEMIVQAGSQQPFGVMIARGDLAVELGFQRMAEIQEEILWLCEAAHIPVIWATQVLETLVKTGIPTRAEMTDAAMSQRADCVMLNKGQFVSLGVSVLDDVLRRMDSHRAKNISQLRPLKVWS